MWSILQEQNQFDVLRSIEDNQFDSIVTDPPYELGFMGKKWDSSGIAYNVELWTEAYRVLKPGGYLLAFGGTRTYHRMACAIEDAGFEIRDSLDWIYGSGFPKSLNITKAIDKAAGVEFSSKPASGVGFMNQADDGYHNTNNQLTCEGESTEAAKEWEGWGTALKPAHEPIVMARKPLSERTVAGNVLVHGTGGINVDGCRVATTDHWKATGKQSATGTSYAGSADGSLNISVSSTHDDGRWPPNILLSDAAAEEMDEQSGTLKPGERPAAKGIKSQPGANGTMNAGWAGSKNENRIVLDSGGASRFFPCFKYNAKAPKKERPVVEGIKPHATVKPVAVMRWLVRLVTPPNGTCLDMFCGSGTTGEACELEGFNSLMIDKDPDSIAMANERMSKFSDSSLGGKINDGRTTNRNRGR